MERHLSASRMPNAVASASKRKLDVTASEESIGEIQQESQVRDESSRQASNHSNTGSIHPQEKPESVEEQKQLKFGKQQTTLRGYGTFKEPLYDESRRKDEPVKKKIRGFAKKPKDAVPTKQMNLSFVRQPSAETAAAGLALGPARARRQEAGGGSLVVNAAQRVGSSQLARPRKEPKATAAATLAGDIEMEQLENEEGIAQAAVDPDRQPYGNVHNADHDMQDSVENAPETRAFPQPLRDVEMDDKPEDDEMTSRTLVTRPHAASNTSVLRAESFSREEKISSTPRPGGVGGSARVNNPKSKSAQPIASTSANGADVISVGSSSDDEGDDDEIIWLESLSDVNDEEQAEEEEEDEDALERMTQSANPKGKKMSKDGWKDFRSQNASEVKRRAQAVMTELRPLVKKKFEAMPRINAASDTASNDFKNPFDQLADDTSTDSSDALSIARAIKNAAPDKQTRDAIVRLFRRIPLLAPDTSAPVRTSALAQSKAFYKPIKDAVLREAPHLKGLLQDPTGLVNAPTAFYLNYPPMPVVDETIDSPCATMRLIRAQGHKKDQATLLCDVIFAHRAIPPKETRELPGDHALFDVNAPEDARVDSLVADEIFFRAHQYLTRRRALYGTLTVVAGEVAWQNVVEALKALPATSASGKPISVHDLNCMTADGVFFEAKVVVGIKKPKVDEATSSKNAKDTDTNRKEALSVFIHVSHPSAIFTRLKDANGARLHDMVNSLLHTCARTVDEVPPGAFRVYQDLVPEVSMNSAQRQLKELRKREFMFKKAVPKSEIPPEVIALFPEAVNTVGLTEGAINPKGSKTILRSIAQHVAKLRSAKLDALIPGLTATFNESRRAANEKRFQEMSEEEQKMNKQRLVDGMTKWEASARQTMVAGKGTLMTTVHVNAAETRGLMSDRRLPNGPEVRDEIKYLAYKGLRPRLKEFMRAGVSKCLIEKRADRFPRNWRSRLTNLGVKIHGWPEDYAIGVDARAEGKQTLQALYEMAQAWQLIVDGGIYFSRSGKNVFGFEDMDDKWKGNELEAPPVKTPAKKRKPKVKKT